MKAAFTLIPAESRRLIAKAVVGHDKWLYCPGAFGNEGF
jgi:hypothetical protein